MIWEFTGGADTVMQLTFCIIAIFYIIFSIILHYHWESYSMSLKITRMTYTYYFIASGLVLIPMALIAFIF